MTLLFAAALLHGGAGWSRAEPVRIDPANPHYFLVDGKTTALVGASHISYRWWANTKANYAQMLQVTAQNRLNVFRIWQNTSQIIDGGSGWLHPWNRSSTPGAGDGQNKFDLDSWNSSYFSRLRDLVQRADQLGIVVEITFFTMCYSAKDWDLHPLKASNNIQKVGSGAHYDFLTLKDPNLVARQRALIRKTLVELNQFDNVIYEVANEPYFTEDYLGSHAPAAAWHDAMIQEFVSTEANLPKKHLLGANFPEGYSLMGRASQLSFLNAHYTWGDYWEGSMELLDHRYSINKPLGFDESSHLPWWSGYGATDARVEAWEFLIGGGAMYNGLIGGTFGGDVWGTVESAAQRAYLGVLVDFLGTLDLRNMRRDTTTIVAGGTSGNRRVRAISNPGKQYAVYIHYSARTGRDDAFYNAILGVYTPSLTMRLPAGSYRADWINPATGLLVGRDSFSHSGGDKVLQAPLFTIDIALRLTQTGSGGSSGSDGTPPTITSQPASRTVQPGQSVGFSVSATGSAPLSYQWRLNGSDIPGATSSSYSIGSVQPSHEGNYTVVVRNSFGSVTSATATLTIDSSGGSGDSLISNGSFELGYADWNASGNQRVKGGIGTEGQYGVQFNSGQREPDAVLSQSFETVPGRTYVLTFDYGTYSGGVDAEQRIGVAVRGTGSLLSQVVSADGSAPGLQYKRASFTFVADSHLATITFSDASPTSFDIDSVLDNVEIRPGAGSAAPVIASHPQSLTRREGESAAFQVSATGTAPLSFQWRFNGANIPGAAGSSYTIPSVHAGHAGSYDVVVQNSAGSVASRAAVLTVEAGGGGGGGASGLANGSFESSYANWNAGGNQRIVPRWSTHGFYAVQFNHGQSTPNAVLSQAFGTVPGQAYVLEFDYGALSADKGQEQRLAVSITGNGTLLSRQVSAFTEGATASYQRRSFSFVANSSTTTLTLQDVSPTTVDVDSFLDNLRLAAASGAAGEAAQPLSAETPLLLSEAGAAVAAVAAPSRVTAQPDAMTVIQGGSSSILNSGAASVLANDAAEGGASLAAVLLTPPNHGDLQFNPDGTFSYSHHGGGDLSDQFTYAATDGQVPSEPVVVRVSVFRVTSLERSGADLTVSFNSGSGSVSQVEYNLSSPKADAPWQALTEPLAGTDGIVRVTHPGAATAARIYYRVKSQVAGLTLVSPVFGSEEIVLPPGVNQVVPSLQPPALFSGHVRSASRTSVEVNGNPWPAEALAQRDGFSQYILAVQTGAAAGRWWPVVNNTADSVIVDGGEEKLGALLKPGDHIEVRKLTSLADLVGKSSEGSLLNPDTDTNPDPLQEDVVHVTRGQAFQNTVFYHNGSSGAPGYYCLDPAGLVGPLDGSTICLSPDEPVTIHRTGGPLAIRVLGEVRENKMID